MKIVYQSNRETIVYAAEELKKYLQRMDEELKICIEQGLITEDTCKASVCLGILDEFGLDASDVEDAMTDDVIDISVKEGSGYIAGSNDRSVLLGVYQYLKSAGCMWPRPGDEGEYIPKKDICEHVFQYRKKADFPFRGECIEGAVSFEHLRDTIVWAPKVGMNLFMMEQVVPYNYMGRWYAHEDNVLKESENVGYEEVAEMVADLEKLIKKCGLQLHALGHGYLLEPYGIHYVNWKTKYELTEEAKEDVALVKGKRDLFQGSPNFTQLCFSKDRARLGLVRFLVEYLEKKPYIDFLHVWLSDAPNNQCECENCAKKRPADFYVQMLNELDEELTKRGIQTKIVFIMYIDTLWAPETETLHNPDRFIMTTATTRNYNEPFENRRYEEALPPYQRNKHRVKASFAMTLSFMDAWKPAFDGKKFIYDYYMYTTHYFDPGYFQISKLMLEDTKQLKALGFDGIMSDQTQRSYLPNGLPNAVLGEGLFDENLDFEIYSKAYFQAAYGANWEACYVYLQNITQLFKPEELRSNESVVVQDTGIGEEVVRHLWKGNQKTIERLEKIAPYICKFMPTIEKNVEAQDICHAKSWKLLKYHAELCVRTADIYLALAKEDKDAARKLLEKTVYWISSVEDEIALEFDLVLYKQRMTQTIEK